MAEFEKRIQYRKDSNGNLVEQRIGSAADIVTYDDTNSKLGLTELNVQKAIEKVADLANSGGDATEELRAELSTVKDTADEALSDALGLLNGDLTAKKAECDASGNNIASTYIKASAKGTANGIATLGTDGKVPSSQLPSYVDDVIEGTLTNNTTFTPSDPTDVTQESGKIYVDTVSKKTYRWSGNGYVEISASLALGETSSTAYAGDKGKANADKIAELEEDLGIVSDEAHEAYSGVQGLLNGTLTAKKAESATSATSATSADKAAKLSSAKTIELTGDITGSVSTDFSGNASIDTELSDTGVQAGTWCAVTVDEKGRVTAGNHILEWGTAGQTSPSNTTAVGGLFMKLVN